MSNHVHLLLASGVSGLVRLMRRLLTGYAVSYKLRHRRHGHIFQNRYESIVCDSRAIFALCNKFFPTDCARFPGSFQKLSFTLVHGFLNSGDSDYLRCFEFRDIETGALRQIAYEGPCT